LLTALQIVLFLTYPSAVRADYPPPGDSASAAMHERVATLEAELSAAQKEVARLEAELADARLDLAGREDAPTVAVKDRQPVALTRLRESRLQDGGIRDVSRVDRLVPGMIYSQTGNEARFALRGAYTNRTGPEAEPVVGIYEDGVQATTTTDALGPYVDVERIDVLRGPQGVLHGRNALAGAIVVSTNNPDPSAWDMSLEGIIGHSDLTRFEAMLNIPVLETLAVRLAGASESYQGYVNNYVLEESDADDLKTRAQQYVRLGVRWQPRPNFSLQLNFASLDQNGTGSGIWGYQQVGAMIDGEYHPGHQFAPPGASTDFGPLDIARNMASLAELENLSTTLVLDWNLGFANLHWLTNKSKFESLQAFDSDYSNGGSTYDSDFNGWDSFMDTWSSDLRLQSVGEGRFDWIAGLNWLERETDWGWLQTLGGALSRPGWDIASWDPNSMYVTESMAAYASAGFRLGEDARLFAGLRWYDEQKQSKLGNRASWDGVLWNAGIEYAVSATTQAYLSASTGYRPGSINGGATLGVPDNIDQETMTTYQLGVQTLLADETIRLDLTAYLSDYEDVQAHSLHLYWPPGPADLIDYLITAGDKESVGLEAEFEWSPDEHWQIAAQFAWLDARFDGYAIPDMNGLDDIPGYDWGARLDLDGRQPAFSPEWMVGLQTSYRLDLGRWGSLRPVLHARLISDYYTNDLNLPGALQEAHSVTDLRLFWRLPRDQVSLQLYIENFTSGKVLNSTVIYNPQERPDIATFLADWSDTQRYGLTLSYRY
ncbi:MAG: TonB-dependent receptor, partial [Lysobacterales bacterium]